MFAVQIDERHFSDRFDWRTGLAWVCNDDGEKLRAAHSDVDPVSVKDEPEASRTVRAVTRTQ
jgi:hypothetical protein